LREQGKAYKEVTELLGISRNTVYLSSKRDSLEPYKRAGRPKKNYRLVKFCQRAPSNDVETNG
jgi:transposase